MPSSCESGGGGGYPLPPQKSGALLNSYVISAICVVGRFAHVKCPIFNQEARVQRHLCDSQDEDGKANALCATHARAAGAY